MVYVGFITSNSGSRRRVNRVVVVVALPSYVVNYLYISVLGGTDRTKGIHNDRKTSGYYMSPAKTRAWFLCPKLTVDGMSEINKRKLRNHVNYLIYK